MAEDVDLQAVQILVGLDELTEVLKLGTVRVALDLEKNAKTARQHDLLARLHRSLSQYATRHTGLCYVGMIGHFSSGKSSTINSLLEVAGTADARETGQNPTDRFITLISHPKNSNSLLGIAREGSVTIRYHGLENKLLEDAVLVDTPGSGDPGLVTEMVRDFLPLCDLVLFVFSAASPFDAADVALLTEIHENLDFVPLHFVVTRANEFASDTTKILDDDNIDRRETRKFFDALIPRVNNLTQPKIYTEINFTLIDNHQNYNISEVKNIISDRSNPNRVDVKISMRDHKIFYFRNTATDILDFFVNFIVDKRNSLEQVVEQSKKNIDRYNQAVSISNIQLTRRWHEQFTRITSTQSDARAEISATAFWPQGWEQLDTVQKRRREVSAQIAEESKRLAGVINARIRDRAIYQISEYMRTYKSSFDLAGFFDDTNPAIPPIHVELRKEAGPVGFTDPKRIANWWDELRQSEVEALTNLNEGAKRRISNLESLVKSRRPFAVAEKSVEEMQGHLIEDLARFFSQVELYLDGVVSLATKENVAALGIGGHLDNLLVALQETDKAIYEQEAKDAVFPDFSSMQLRLSASLADIGDRIRKLYDELRTERPPTGPEIVDGAFSPQGRPFDASGFKDEAEQTTQLAVDYVANESTKRISDDLSAIRLRYKDAIANAKRERRNRYAIATLGFGGVFSIVVALLYFAGVPIGNNIGEVIVWGVLSNLVGDAVGFSFSKLTDSFPSSKRDIRARFETEARSRLDIITSEMSENGKFTELELTNVAQFTHLLNDSVDMRGAVWEGSADEYYKKMSAFNNRISILSDECISLIDQLRSFADYFANPEKTLEGLIGVGERIKKQAIEPSFQLLDNTQKQLEDVEERMRKIKFV